MAVRARFGVIMVMRVRVAVGVFVLMRLFGGVGVLRIVQMGDVVLVQIIVIVFIMNGTPFFFDWKYTTSAKTIPYKTREKFREFHKTIPTRGIIFPISYSLQNACLRV